MGGGHDPRGVCTSGQASPDRGAGALNTEARYLMGFVARGPSIRDLYGGLMVDPLHFCQVLLRECGSQYPIHGAGAGLYAVVLCMRYLRYLLCLRDLGSLRIALVGSDVGSFSASLAFAG